MDSQSSKDFTHPEKSGEFEEEDKETASTHAPVPEELKPDLEVISALKELCEQLVENSKLSEHFSTKSKLFKVLPKEGEQSLKQFQSYMKFIEIIEPNIETFLEAKGLQEEKVYESIQKVANFNEQYLTDIELLIAATDYEVFSKLMNTIYRNGKKGKKEIEGMELV